MLLKTEVKVEIVRGKLLKELGLNVLNTVRPGVVVESMQA